MNFEKPFVEEESKQEKSPEELQKIGENVMEAKRSIEEEIERLEEEKRNIMQKEEDQSSKERLDQIEILLSSLRGKLAFLEGIANED